MVLHHISGLGLFPGMSGRTVTRQEGFQVVPGIILLAFFCTFLCIPVLAAPDTGMHSPDTVTVVMDNNYPPFSFRDASGNLVGISVDMWRLWEKQTGKTVEITGLGWDDAIHRMEAGEFDVIDTVFYSEERAKIYDFTPSYTDVDVVIFFNANISGIADLDSLDGFVVGMHKGDSTIEDVAKKGVMVREYGSYEDVVIAAKNGEIVVFILDKPSGIYYLYKQGIQDQFRHTPPVIKGALHRAVKKGNATLLAEINAGFSQIPKSEYEALDRTWYGTPVMNTEYLKVVAVFAGAVFLIIVVLVIWNRTLNRTVTERTAELKEELEQRKQAEAGVRKSHDRFRTVMDSLDSLVYVADMNTYELLFINKYGRDIWGDITGNVCWQTLQTGQGGPCPFCTNNRLLNPQGNPAEVLVWQFQNTITKRWYECRDSAIQWPDGRTVRLEIATDITGRKRADEELHQKSGELSAAYEKMTTTADELKLNYDELCRSQQALEQARKKLNLLNTVTFQDIQNAVFSLSGYLQLEIETRNEEERRTFREKETVIVKTISESLTFAKNYQNLGLKPPLWQNVQQVFLVGISHVDLTGISKKPGIKDLEIYADPLLERVFFTLVENVILHGKTATEISLHHSQTDDGLILVFEDNGVGIPDAMKENIFTRKYEEKKGLGLFLVREILGITGITIRETGIPGKGAQFEMTVPKGAYRFT